jgi:hypothetical protein
MRACASAGRKYIPQVAPPHALDDSCRDIAEVVMERDPFVISENIRRWRAKLEYEPDPQIRKMLHQLITEYEEEARHSPAFAPRHSD